MCIKPVGQYFTYKLNTILCTQINQNRSPVTDLSFNAGGGGRSVEHPVAEMFTTRTNKCTDLCTKLHILIISIPVPFIF